MQKSKILIFLLALLFGFLGFEKPAFSYFQNYNFFEKIENFEAKIEIQKDGSFLVEESIEYNFGLNKRHGIYRTIPLDKIKIKVLDVLDESGKAYPYETSINFKTLRIKIGDPNKLVRGTKKYRIIYKVQNGLLFFKDHDELYWNVTGNNWKVPIKNAKAIVILPENLEEDQIQAECYTGIYGSKEKDCECFITKGKVEILTKRELLPKEGLTIAIGFPKGIVASPSLLQRFGWTVEKYWPFFIPLFVFIFLFYKWYKEGRDPRLKKSIMVQYEPPDNLRPAQVSAILKQKLSPTDISATIIDLAVSGYIKIKEIEKKGWFQKNDYEFEKLKDWDDLLDYEQKILRFLFGRKKDKVVLSELRRKHFRISKVYKSCFKELANERYFSHNPYKVFHKWRSIGISLVILGIIVIYFLNPFLMLLHSVFFQMPTGFLLGISIAFSGVLFLIFAPFMPKRTKKGMEAYWHILGFRDYIKTAEKYRAQFYEKAHIFEKYLPYAIVFNLTHKWAKAFEGIYREAPSWYEGRITPTFSTIAFCDALNTSITNFGGMFAGRSGGARSGFSGLGGGGFSGGGFGGGGGGSW